MSWGVGILNIVFNIFPFIGTIVQRFNFSLVLILQHKQTNDEKVRWEEDILYVYKWMMNKNTLRPLYWVSMGFSSKSCPLANNLPAISRSLKAYYPMGIYKRLE